MDPGLATARAQGLDALADATVDRWLSAQFRAAHPEVDTRLRAMMKRTSVAGYCAYVGAFIEMDFEARLPALQVPTPLLAAEHDHGGGPVEAMREMAARLPGASLQVIAGVGHIVNHEGPEAVSAALRGFLGAGDVLSSAAAPAVAAAARRRRGGDGTAPRAPARWSSPAR